jgi:hypothetical protein
MAYWLDLSLGGLRRERALTRRAAILMSGSGSIAPAPRLARAPARDQRCRLRMVPRS